MLTIGLTGGIASGKSTCSDLFAELGAPIIDTDLLARRLVEPGQGALTTIVQTFGEAILTPDGKLDRIAVRNLVFNDPAKRKQLENILHPLIRQEVERQLEQISAPYCIVVIPLLLESGMTDLVDRILVVDTTEEIQRQRLQMRDGMEKSVINGILAAQIKRQSRLQAAQDIIENTGDLEALRSQVVELHKFYCSYSPSA